MQTVSSEFVKDKKVLLRYDIDVVLSEVGYQKSDIRIKEDFKLKAGLDTLNLCLDNASKVIIIGHLGRPFAKAEDEKKDNPKELSAKPIQEWLELHLPAMTARQAGLRGGRESSGLSSKESSGSHPGGEAKIEFATTLEQANQSTSRIVLLENTRFFHGEVPGSEYHASCESKTCDIDFAKQLANLVDPGQAGTGVYVNEAFSSHHKAASTTIVPTLLPHAAGLHFIKEVETILNVRNNPKKPFIAVIGGAKVNDDKLPVIKVLLKKADAILVGGKLIKEIREQQLELPKNVLVGKLNQDGFDIAEETTSAWSNLISKAAMIVWNGPLGKFEEEKSPVDSSSKYNQTEKVAQLILDSGAEVVIGGGDSVAALSQYGLLEKAQSKAFVSVGGGAMLKLLADGTLPTIEALKS